MKLIGMLIAALALVPPAKAEAPKTAVLECEMEWVKDGEQINKRVSVQIDFTTKMLFVSDWNAEGLGIWDMQGGVLKFSVGRETQLILMGAVNYRFPISVHVPDEEQFDERATATGRSRR